MGFIFLDNWNKTEYPYKKLDFGKWELNLPANSDGTPMIAHLTEIKVRCHLKKIQNLSL